MRHEPVEAVLDINIEDGSLDLSDSKVLDMSVHLFFIFVERCKTYHLFMPVCLYLKYSVINLL